jgi:hypothetical protein
MGAASESVGAEKDTPSRTRPSSSSDVSTTSALTSPAQSRVVSAAGESPRAAAQIISRAGPNAAVLQRAQRSYGNQFVQRVMDTTTICCKSDRSAPADMDIAPPADGGELFDTSTRHPLETYFGADLSDVRVHTSRDAGDSARAINAAAYATGRDIYFAPGMYSPGTDRGRRLLAHEVAHVVQQSSGMVPTKIATKTRSGTQITATDDPLERLADRDADSFMEKASPAPTPGTSLRRPPASDSSLVQLHPASTSAIQRDQDTNQAAATATAAQQQTGAVAPTQGQDISAPQPAPPPFPITIMPKDPDRFVVPETASRADIAERLFGDSTREAAFTFPVTGGVPVVANTPGKAVRVTAFAALLEPARNAMQDALDGALADDIRSTVSILSQRIIGAGSEEQLSENTLRWSNRNDLLRRDGTNYFVAFLNRLSDIKLTEDHILWTTEKTALEWLVIEAESTREQVKKAITLRSSFNVDYEAPEGTDEFAPSSVIGRFYYSDGGSLQIMVVRKISEAGTLDSALMSARDSDFIGLRAVVPSQNPNDPTRQIFRAYALIAPTVNDPLVKHAEDDPGGHYYWYHPGTVMIPFGGFEKDFAKGGEAEDQQRRTLLFRALQDAQFGRLDYLVGLDYDVLSIATNEERIQIVDYLVSAGVELGPSSAAIARVITSASPSQRRALEQSLRDSDLLDAIIKIPDPAITAALGPTTSEQEEQALDRLEGGQDVFKLYQKWLGDVLSMSGPTPEQSYELASKIKELGFSSLPEFLNAISHFEDTFERFAVQVAFQMLDENEALAKGEFARYGGAPSTGGIADLRKELAVLKPQVHRRNYAIQDRDAAHDRAVQLRPAAGISEEYEAAAEAETALNQKAAQEIAATNEMVKGVQAHFPVLADPSLDVTQLIDADDVTLQSLLQNTALARLSDIDKARYILSHDTSEVWRLEGVLARARVQMGIIDGSIFDLMLRAKEKREQRESIFKAILIAALSLGLAIFGGPLGLAAAAAISTYTAVTHIQEYITKQIMVGTAFDRAQALSADEPSFFWLALDIVGAIVDASAAVKAMTALKPVVKEALAVKDAVEQARKLEQVESVAKSLESGQHAADASQAAAKSADTIAQDAKAATHAGAPASKPAAALETVTPATKGKATGAAKAATETVESAEKTENLAAKVVADVKKRIAGQAAIDSLGAEGEALVNLCKGDVAAAGGLARIDSSTRAGIVAALKDSPEAARLLGNLAAESDAVADSAEKLFKAFVTEGKRADQFEAILKKYFIVRGSRIRKASMLRALGEAGLEDADYARLAEQMKGLSATNNVQTEFSRNAIAAISEKLPPGAEGIRKITEMSKWMETGAKGSMFEQWARRNIFQGMKRFSEETAGMAGKYTRTLLLSDGVLSDGAQLTVVELKNYVDTLPTFARNTAEGKQLANYAEMIAQKVKGPGDLPFTKVNYVFSTEEAAKSAAPNIKAALQQNVLIQFIDPKTGTAVALKL